MVSGYLLEKDSWLSSLQALWYSAYYPMITCINTENNSGFNNYWGTQQEPNEVLLLFIPNFFLQELHPSVCDWIQDGAIQTANGRNTAKISDDFES